MIPGALTPTEVIMAWKAGSDFVKVFPCSQVGGPGYIRALKAPFPHVPLIASGGVNQQTASDFILAGAVALGIGGPEQAWREAALAIGMGAVVAMPVLSRRFYRLASVIELTPFAIIEVRADGRRRWLYWTQPLELRNYRWLRRLELAPQGGQGHIPIHYARIGFERLLAVVLERGGFRKPPHAA